MFRDIFMGDNDAASNGEVDAAVTSSDAEAVAGVNGDEGVSEGVGCAIVVAGNGVPEWAQSGGMNRASPGLRMATYGCVFGIGFNLSASISGVSDGSRMSIVEVVEPAGNDRCLISSGGKRMSFLVPRTWKRTFAMTS